MKNKTLPAKPALPVFEWWKASNGRFYMHRKHRNGNLTEANSYKRFQSVVRRCQRLAPSGYNLKPLPSLKIKA